MNENIKFENLIDVGELQRLMDEFYSLTNIPIGIVDTNNDIKVATGWQTACTKFHRKNSETLINCLESDNLIREQLQVNLTTTYKCKNNLWEIAQPIIFENFHVATIFLGHFHYDDDIVDIAFFEQQAEKYNFDKKEYLMAIEALPKYSKEFVQKIMNFYTQLAKMIVLTGFSNYKFQNELELRQQKEEEIINTRNLAQMNADYFLSIFEQSPIMFWEEDFEELKKHIDFLQAENNVDLKTYLDNNPEELKNCISKFKIINVNEATLKTLEYTSKEELILGFSQTITKVSIGEFKKALVHLANSYTYYESQTEHRTKSGIIKQFFIKSFVPAGYEKTYSKVIVAMIDITEIRKYEQKLIESLSKSEESDKLKTAFLNNISHEIRTPLNGILGFSELLVLNPNSDKSSFFKEYISQCSDQLLTIVDNIIEISRIQSEEIKLDIKALNINDLINELVGKIAQKLSNKGIEFIHTNKFSVKGNSIKSDKIKVLKILDCVLDNAIKFTHEGRVEFHCLNRSGNEFEFIITDTGIGITSDEQNYIFETFRQVENSITRQYGGNGIGLSIVKAYVDKLGGSIMLKSEVNKGTTFSIILPFEYDTNLTNTFASADFDLFTLKNKTILVTEDDESNYPYLDTILVDNSVKVLYAKNGQVAVDICRNNNAVDLILMDIRMPIMDGVTATRLIKNFCPGIKIIAQTAYAYERDKEDLLSGSFDDYISKPINSKDLIHIISKHLL